MGPTPARVSHGRPDRRRDRRTGRGAGREGSPSGSRAGSGLARRPEALGLRCRAGPSARSPMTPGPCDVPVAPGSLEGTPDKEQTMTDHSTMRALVAYESMFGNTERVAR